MSTIPGLQVSFMQIPDKTGSNTSFSVRIHNSFSSNLAGGRYASTTDDYGDTYGVFLGGSSVTRAYKITSNGQLAWLTKSGNTTHVANSESRGIGSVSVIGNRVIIASVDTASTNGAMVTTLSASDGTLIASKQYTTTTNALAQMTLVRNTLDENGLYVFSPVTTGSISVGYGRLNSDLTVNGTVQFLNTANVAQHSVRSAVYDVTGHYLYTSGSISLGQNRGWIAKWNSNQTVNTQVYIGANTNQGVVNRIMLHNDGNIYYSMNDANNAPGGATTGIIVVKANTTLGTTWTTYFGAAAGSVTMAPAGMDYDSSGNIWVAATVQANTVASVVSTQRPTLIACINQSGTVLALYEFSCLVTNATDCLVTDIKICRTGYSAGQMYISGWYMNTSLISARFVVSVPYADPSFYLPGEFFMNTRQGADVLYGTATAPTITASGFATNTSVAFNSPVDITGAWVDDKATFTIANTATGDAAFDTQWNPFVKSSNTIIVSNTTIYHGTATGNQSSGSTCFRYTGKWYFEMLYNKTGSLSWQGGVATEDIGTTATTVGANAQIGFALDLTTASTPKQYPGNINTTGMGTFTSGTDVLSVAVDCDNKLIWFGRNGSNWANSGNPGSNTGGRSMANLLSTGVGPAWSAQAANSGSNTTLYANSSTILFSPPSGFTVWDNK